MATNYKVLGQANPAATTATSLYTAPAGTAAVCSTLSVCNVGVSTTFRVAIRPAGATLETKHYLIYDASVNAYDSVLLTLGISLAATDVVTVYAGHANLAFSLYGAEIV